MQLQGPKPAALMVNRNSTKIKKQQHLSHPVIVHLVSPKVIHVKPEEFMGLVQQLTGNPLANNATHPSNTDQTCQKFLTDENPIDHFIGSIEPTTNLSVDFQALMHFVDFVHIKSNQFPFHFISLFLCRAQTRTYCFAVNARALSQSHRSMMFIDW
ncbi:hypothetical protein RJT34_19501 [Clitoria ternatea]|uniref:VQ domain-containing protein n=1 Tax=Clitoria ternatea TaxID=43366 RepID=A0AAN9P3J7_CLITE